MGAGGGLSWLVGGTMLYFKALFDGLDAMPAADPAVRARLNARAAEQGWPALHAPPPPPHPPTPPPPPPPPAVRARLNARAAEQGWPALHAELARVDPVTAARLASGDSQRIQRALEVWQ